MVAFTTATRSDLEEAVWLLARASAPLVDAGNGPRCQLCGRVLPLLPLAGRAGETAPDQRRHSPRCAWALARELAGWDLNRIGDDEARRMGAPVGSVFVFA